MTEPECHHGQADDLWNERFQIGVALSALGVHANVLILELTIIFIVITVSIEEHFLLLFFYCFVFLLTEYFIDGLCHWRVHLVYDVHAGQLTLIR